MVFAMFAFALSFSLSTWWDPHHPPFDNYIQKHTCCVSSSSQHVFSSYISCRVLNGQRIPSNLKPNPITYTHIVVVVFVVFSSKTTPFPGGVSVCLDGRPFPAKRNRDGEEKEVRDYTLMAFSTLLFSLARLSEDEKTQIFTRHV